MKFPIHYQHDRMQCGATCLQMVLEHFGRKCSLMEIEEVCPPTSQGVSMLCISKGAEQFGLRTACGKLTMGELERTAMPCILHWRQNHFVVLYNVRKNLRGRMRFSVADPAKGLTTYDKDEMQHGWLTEGKGIVLLLEPSTTFERRERTTQHCRSLRFLYSYFRPYRRQFVWVFLGLLLGSLLQLVIPFLTQAIVDVGINGRQLSMVALILIGQLVLILSGSIVDFVRRRLLLFVGIRINISLVSNYLDKLSRLSMPFFDTRQTGDILQRMTDHGRVRSFLTGQVLSVLFSVVTLVVYGAVLLVYDATIFLSFLAFSAAYAMWVVLFMRHRRLLDYNNFEKQAEAQNRTYQLVTTMQEIKLQGCIRRRRFEWKSTQLDLSRIQMRSLRLQQSQEAGSILIEGIKGLVVTALAAASVIQGNMTLGMMLSVQYIIGQLSSPVASVLGFVYSLQDVRISLERINEVMQKKDEDDGHPMPTSSTASGRGISLRGVTFSYERYSPIKTLTDVSFDIAECKTTAIVGASGCGKTTLLKLILGYYPIECGEILVGGQRLQDCNMEWWRSQCGVVMQDGRIFSDTIKHNISVTDKDIDYNRLIEATQVSQLENYLSHLPLGFDTMVGPDGLTLSMGQRQRLLIARAVYKHPAFLFLDEATNSLDANNERSIVNRLEKFCKGRTVLVIAHRLSTVRRADHIIVMDGGRIVEQGTHKQLVARQGHYYQLVKNQLEL